MDPPQASLVRERHGWAIEWPAGGRDGPFGCRSVAEMEIVARLGPSATWIVVEEPATDAGPA